MMKPIIVKLFIPLTGLTLLGVVSLSTQIGARKVSVYETSQPSPGRALDPGVTPEITVNGVHVPVKADGSALYTSGETKLRSWDGKTTIITTTPSSVSSITTSGSQVKMLVNQSEHSSQQSISSSTQSNGSNNSSFSETSTTTSVFNNAR
jgi:hypothetical protein